MDVQGSELEIVSHYIRLINDRVKGMMIGTHGRVIEGKLIELLYDHDWCLHREKPCRVHPESPTLTQMMALDGCQYWRRKNYAQFVQ